MKVLFATSEVYPLIKTGGLADVSAELPAALKALGEDVKIVLPGYRDVVACLDRPEVIATLRLEGVSATLLRSVLPQSAVEIWLVDAQPFNRRGNPYLGPSGASWNDNAQRFAFFARAIAAVAMGRADIAWLPDIVHCQDWQTGLAPALLACEIRRPAIVFTIHNLAYQGIFPRARFVELGLPPWQWSPEGLEFYGQLSFMKGGLNYADRLTTVSPGYAREIQTPELGCGLDGLLKHRRADVRGIVNGIDAHAWNPARDPLIVKNYDSDNPAAKAANKRALQSELKLPQHGDTALIGMIGRLVQQKGIDLVLDALPGLIGLPVQIALLGTGQPEYEKALNGWAARYPDKFAVRVGYDEALAHRIEAGADFFLMPSRFEPCGLNQMYSQRYGTVPIVRRTGGLQDTVVDATPENLALGAATGVLFDEPSASALLSAVRRAGTLYQSKQLWRQLQRNGMRRDFSWNRSAREYVKLYAQALYAAGR